LNDRRFTDVAYWLIASLSVGQLVGAARAEAQAVDQRSIAESHPPAVVVSQFMEEHCVDCHVGDDAPADLQLDQLGFDVATVENSQVWEGIARKLRTRQMPPPEMPRPSEESYHAMLSILESALDKAAAENPNPGRTDTFRRLTRTEYQNAVRDLLDLDVDVASQLPVDEVSHGFDNVTVADLSPTLLNRYISSAQKISRLAIGRPPRFPDVATVRVRPDVTQEDHVEGLPIGTRGGVAIAHVFPQDGEYEIQVRLTRDRDEHVEGLKEPHEFELLLDRERIRLFTVKPPEGRADPSDPYNEPTHENVDRHLKARIAVTAGQHVLGATFIRSGSSLLESKRQPLNVHFNMYRHPRLTPAVYQVTITGPFAATGPGDTPSRRKIFVRRPTGVDDEEDCAKDILSSLMRQAFRRPIDDEDLAGPLALFRQACERDGFEAGVEMALASILTSPHFLFRIEQQPDGVAPGRIYRISDVELASRLSFFLWSSIPDDELLDLAERGELRDKEVLKKQVERMLADKRSTALVENFGGQWLYLRNLESSTPDMRLFPDFDDNLRQAMRRETELFLASVIREDHSVLDFLKSDYTYLNERLAKHYGVPHVYGSRFRRVALSPDSKRGGLLRNASVLTVTSYATRTSPVIRGKWILENLLGTPPPPPPDNVPPLKDNTVAANLSVRERLAEHRANTACASCHDLIDPVGLSLENFDAVGRWRELEEDKPIDAAGGLPDGSVFTGVDGLEQGLLDRPEIFVGTMTEKLLTYALGRGVEHYDAPAVRKIVRVAKSDDFRFSSLILGIVNSTPFQMRMSQ